VVSGTSPNSAVRVFREGEAGVELATVEEGGSEDFLKDCAAPSLVRRSNGSPLGDSGEKEGNEVRDLSEMDEAELDI
jgi:hypothetical protein